jgi:hypothetical protein
MGTLIRVIFREGVPRQRAANRAVHSRRSAIARERGLTLWREREDLVIAAAYRVAPRSEAQVDHDAQVSAFVPLKLAPQA